MRAADPHRLEIGNSSYRIDTNVHSIEGAKGENMKTIYTAWFEARKAEGKVKKIGKAFFHDGRKAMERTLWSVDDEEVIVMNGNAHKFRRYPDELQNRSEYIKGCI